MPWVAGVAGDGCTSDNIGSIVLTEVTSSIMRNITRIRKNENYDNYERYRVPTSAGGARSTRIGHGM